ncbi:MLO-like protein 4 isoform X2 [Silene latifolia]|uniref:MLO-like protein 4 isoform X2 n=1 Tax=Silene latifolia TaxID=37657 RepID=UPI003D771D65
MVEGRSLATTPTWAVATVIAVMIGTVFLFNNCIELLGKWLDKRKRKPLIAALDKIKEELMVFGVMSLLLGHWSIFVAKICVKTTKFGSRVNPCIPETKIVRHVIISNYSREGLPTSQNSDDHDLNPYCDEGYESFASYESLEQLHRLLFVLGVTHITYSSIAIALAVFKIYSWRVWESEAKSMALQASSDNNPWHPKLRRLCTFVLNHASHPWTQHKILVWLLCFGRQFWSSINKSDYIALRFGFITVHQLPLSYDFLNYMARSMHDEFRDIVGISVPLWIYAIFCVYLDFHGSRAYFFLSFLPAVIIILIGTKLHRIVVKLALETVDSSPYMKTHVFKLRDELFWLRKPKLLLRLIQFTSFQNAFEMAMFIWSLWEISGTSCFMKNPTFMGNFSSMVQLHHISSLCYNHTGVGLFPYSNIEGEFDDLRYTA